ncbi:radical S-adenosyl methionine domain-containing protein 1, mitochondrial isoform X2 [Nematostella vectensis]|uniref:radical S-adenosyl methionine domain-containing protein 1, mitochondrial isoform X2 n=1 Tax=Nematostella vectensis TaxID=45351 RepID=UPI00138FDCB7|nr:radical S-adenosyl methionine domain-containing protein 1, mitochondrial isoform X2 [Nematostella vectensis]
MRKAVQVRNALFLVRNGAFHCSSKGFFTGSKYIDEESRISPQHQHDAKEHVSDMFRWSKEATIYVHWPYCKSLCSFCNFNKYVREFIDHERMKKCLVKECKSLLEISGAKTINSVYFGGGTPSLAKPSTFSAILECLQQKGVLNPNAEVTLEANPTSAESHKLRDFKTAGINRLSLGVQSLSEDELAVLGRQGSCLESLKSLDMAKVLFPGRVSVDLMFGRPKQTAPEWERELEEILPLCDNHISIYQLTLHRGTSLFRQVQEGKLVVPDSDQMADLYLTTVDVLEKAGFYQYEVSNFAKPVSDTGYMSSILFLDVFDYQHGCESQHNLSYWRGVPYIGIGPGAHGRFYEMSDKDSKMKRVAWVQTLEPNSWMKEVEEFGHGTRKKVFQSNAVILEEIIMLGLRTSEGIPNERFNHYITATSSGSLREIFEGCSDVRDFMAEGLLQLDERCKKGKEKRRSLFLHPKI